MAVEDQVARLAHDPRAGGVVAHHLVEQFERAAGGEGSAGASQQRDPHVGVAVDGEPHVGEFTVDGRIHGIQARPVHGDAQDAGDGTVEGRPGKLSSYRTVMRPARLAGGFATVGVIASHRY